MGAPEITIAPAVPTDYPAIARLEAQAFWSAEFSRVAFGPLRATDEAIARRAASFAKVPKNPKERLKYVKAVGNLEGEEGQILGFAAWSFISGKDEARDGDSKGEEESPWPVGANVKFCEEFFLSADESMIRSVDGDKYAKLSVLIVSPKYQRMGIGSKLLEEGLREVDEAGLQAVLGASPDGEGLYKKFGFQEFEVMERNLWELKGGEGCGIARHVVMHRPATKRI